MSQAPSRAPFYGWYIVAMALFANFMSVGTNFYIFNAFMEPLCGQRGWTRTDINVALMIGTFVGFLGQVVYGTLVMRIGPRSLMTFGAVLAGVSFIFLGRAGQLWTFYALYVLLFMGNGALGGIVANTAVNNWFVRKRGSALGMATAGVSLSGAVIPFLALILLEKTGLVGSFFWIGLALILTSPLTALIIRNRPEDHGMHPDGLAPGPSAGAGEGQEEADSGVWSAGQVFRSGAFWKVSMAFGLTMIGVVGVMSQLKPRFSDIGFDSRTAMAMMSVTALLGTFGKYFWGMICDRFDPRRVVAVLMAGNALGLGLALWQGSMAALVLFIVVFGFAMGGVMSTFPVIIADLFGRESFAPVLRFAAIFLILQLLGYLIAGRSYDLTGSYNTAYAVFIGLDVVAVALVMTADRPTRVR